MPFIAAVTQPEWVTTLREYGSSVEVNFWRPGRQRVSAAHFGSPMIFVQKGSSPRPVPGFGVIDRYELLSIREAWARWRWRNGVRSLEEFVKKVSKVAAGTSSNDGGITNRMEGANTLIGCVVLRNVFFFPEGYVPTVDQILPDFPRNVVSYKVYSNELPEPFSTYALQAVTAENCRDDWHSPLNPLEKAVIEQQGMLVCEAMFTNYQVFDVSRPKLAAKHVGIEHPGYDVLVRKDGSELHVEVKGSKLRDPVITITRNELDTAADDLRARLLVVRAIRTYQDEEGWHAIGGTPTLYRWVNHNAIRAALDASRAGELHNLELKTPEWSLDVGSTDLLQVEEVNRKVVSSGDGCP